MNSGYDRWQDIVDREIVGEEVSAEELRFARDFERLDEAAGVEVELFAELGRGAELAEIADGSALAERAVAAVLAERAAQKRRVARRVAWSAAGLALAAGAALWVSSTGRAPVAPLATSVIEYADGAVMVDGKAAALGTRIAQGSEVSVATGVGCIAVEPSIHLCLAPGAKVRLDRVGDASRRVELLSGRVATALDPLRPGERYSIVTRGTFSTAVGTAFSVELLESSVRTVVHEGKVRVGKDPASGELVTAHKIGLSTAGGTSIDDLVDHVATETPEWAALARVANRSIEAPLGVPRPAETTREIAEIPSEVSPTPAHARPPAERHEAKAPAVEERPETAADLLAHAREALRGQSWREAASAYREIVSRFPGSPEARTVLVPLAGLEIDRLGQPEIALGHLQTYLSSGGALAMEARLAQIRAYRALGRQADEARAIDEFLAAHPDSLEAAKLRERRQALP